jgi:hypothetical protein
MRNGISIGRRTQLRDQARGTVLDPVSVVRTLQQEGWIKSEPATSLATLSFSSIQKMTREEAQSPEANFGELP